MKHIQIKKLEHLENTIDDITIASDINAIDVKNVGRAIQEIIDTFKTRMGKRAGYFFLREFRNELGDEYHAIIKEMGVDLRLIDLQNELYSINKGRDFKIKDDSSINIAYIEKNEIC